MANKDTTYLRIRTRAIRKCARDAAALIRDRGWTRGRTSRHRMGMWEAIWAADPKHPEGHPGWDVVPNVIAKIESLICATTKMRHTHGGKKLIPRYNDAPGRTVADVLRLLDMEASGAEDKVKFHYRDYTGRLTNGV